MGFGEWISLWHNKVLKKWYFLLQNLNVSYKNDKKGLCISVNTMFLIKSNHNIDKTICYYETLMNNFIFKLFLKLQPFNMYLC